MAEIDLNKIFREGKELEGKLLQQEKSIIIEKMLQEISMPEQELIELVMAIMNAEVTVDKEQELLECKSASKESLLGIGLEGITHANAAENFAGQALDEFFDSVKFALNISLCNKLSIKINNSKIASIINYEAALELLNNGLLQIKDSFKLFRARGKKLEEINKLLEDELHSELQKQQGKSNSFANRLVNGIKNNITKATEKVKNTIHILDHRSDMMQISNKLESLKKATKALNFIENKIRTKIPNLDIVNFRYDKGKVMVNIRGIGKELDLREHLMSSNLLDEEMASLLKKASGSNDALLIAIEQFEKLLPKNASVQIDKGKIFVEVTLKDTKSRVHIQDYLNDLALIRKNQLQMELKESGGGSQQSQKLLEIYTASQFIDSAISEHFPELKAGIGVRESQKVKSELQKLDALSDMQKAQKDKVRSGKSSVVANEGGKEGYEIDAEKDKAVDEEIDKDNAVNQPDLTEVEDEKNPQVTGKKEGKKEQNKLVTQDIIADKAKALAAVREQFAKGVKDLDKANQNKGLVDEMRKQMEKDRLNGK